MKGKKVILVLLLLAGGVCGRLSAQDLSVGVNVAELANLGTLNVSLGYAVSRHWSVELEGRVNPFSFTVLDDAARHEDVARNVNRGAFNRVESVSLGVRWWPWYFESGAWVGLRARGASYDRAGFIYGKERCKGVGFGACVGGGWALMLSKDLSLDFGILGWAGWRSERVFPDFFYEDKYSNREGFFVSLDEVMVSLVFCF